MDDDLSLSSLTLSAMSQEDVAAAVVRSLKRELGADAGITLKDPSWRLDRPGPPGSRRIQIGKLGTLAVPKGKDGATFAKMLLSRLADYEALQRARHRTARLESLYLAAQTFTAELDLERTLSTIVERGRDLTGTDICYLTLNDLDQGVTYMRTAVGVMTEEFTKVRLRFGEGLGGLVAKEGRPYYSSDYMHDERFIHVQVVDGQVKGEGIVSVVGVPVKLHERAIGVLFIANRYASTFDSEDVAFLQALGDFAGVAIENARLYGVLDHAARLHSRLTDLILSEQPEAALEAAIGNAIGLQVRIRHSTDDRGSERGVSTSVNAGHTLLGRLTVDAQTISQEQRTWLEQAARVVAVQLLKERAVLQAKLRTRGELLDAIVSGAAPADELGRRAASFGLDLAAPHRAVVFEGDRSDDVSKVLPHAFVATRLGNTVALLAPDTAVPSIGLVAAGLVSSGSVGIAQSVVEATRILEVARILGRRDGVLSSRDLGVYSLLLDARHASTLRAQAGALLAPILKYDEEHGNILVPTLEAILDAQGRPTDAARQLSVHVNSVYYRLERIKDVAGFDLDDSEVRLQLHLALRVLRLAPSLM